MIMVVLLAAVLLLVPAPVAGQYVQLLNVTATSDGTWTDWQVTSGSLHIVITGGTATVEVDVSNEATKPADSTHGIALGRTVSATDILPIPGPFRWIKARVTACLSCAVVADLQGTTQGDGMALQLEFGICTNPARVNLPYAISTSADVQMVAATAGKRVWICGLEIVSAGTVSVRLIRGTTTTTPCDTGTTAMEGLNPWTAQTGIVYRITPPGAWKTGVGEALCLDVNAAVSVTGKLLYEIR